ncbi:MAG: zinc ribbon domain-containing protein [Methanoregula sp.]|jgi:predicted  nucleic acid-binding Zn-ribbon protein|uniref:zinc-ribbon domain-containing protein n=1 Tax=Methanoregula sp. TaxID=2052170 RepID=UPI003C28125B
MPKFCPNCGERISDKVKFCPECGAEIKLFSVDKNEKSTVDEKSIADEKPAVDENSTLYENSTADANKNDINIEDKTIERKHRPSRVALYGAGIIVILILLLAIGAVFYTSSHGIPSNIQSIFNLNPAQTGVSAQQMVSASCETAVTPIPSVIVNVTQPPVTPTVIPTTPETKEEYMHRTGGMYLGQGFIINRQNVSGYKDLKVNVSVYRYRFFDGFNESGDAASGTTVYIPRVPDPGEKFLFVFVRMEMPGTDETNDPRMWGFSSSLFAIQYNGSLISEYSKHVKCEPIKEMENTWTQNGDISISDYGYTRVESIAHPTSGNGCSYNSYLRFGKSNAWDGYIIYQVPPRGVR